MRTMLILLVTAVFNLQGCATTASAKEEQKPEAGEAKESWMDKTGKNISKEAKKLKEKGAPYYASCKGEIQKHCSAEEKETTKLGECLKKNKDKFAPGCKSAVEKHFKDSN